MQRKNSIGKFLKDKFQKTDGESFSTNIDPEIYNNRYVFEISWEVVNKVGGIYTVIKTKAEVTTMELGDHYVLIGPLNELCMSTEVDICDLPTGALGDTVNEMRSHGIKVIFGRWLIEGYPLVILFDLKSTAWRIDEWKKELFDSTHIGIPLHDTESNDSVIFGGLITWLLGVFRQKVNKEYTSYVPVIAHFHEWLVGAGLLFCRTRNLDITTVFTTHATLLGRYLSASSADLYNNLSKFDVDKEAGDRNIYHRYCLERAATHCAHSFTTVSEITDIECLHLLKRKADVLTPNGLNVIKFAALHEFQNRHALAKEKIHQFIQGHFYGHHNFDMDKTLYFFIAGRYEFENKGADLFIESLARLNFKLKQMKSDVTVIAFLIFPAKTNNFNVESFRSQAIAKQLRNTVTDIQQAMGKRLFEACLKGNIPAGHDILLQDDIVKLKRCVYGAQRQNLPPICTHNIIDDATDPILSNLRRCQLFNAKNDRVKVIFHPEFLNSNNPLISMDYEEFVRGCHLGVFPSYYEPWGYTPAECTVMGIPSISTNLSGFGCFMDEHVTDPKSYGIYVVDRRTRSSEESVEQLTNYMAEFSQYSRRQRIVLRNRTERLSEILDWNNLGFYYRKARLIALAKQCPNLFNHYSSISIDDKDCLSEKSFHINRPYSAPGSPSMSGFSTPKLSESGRNSPSTNDFNEDEVDEDNERIELGLATMAVKDSDED